MKAGIKLAAVSWSKVKKQMSKEIPIIARIGWQVVGGHFVVIRGYQEVGNKKYLYINDPCQ